MGDIYKICRFLFLLYFLLLEITHVSCQKDLKNALRGSRAPYRHGRTRCQRKEHQDILDVVGVDADAEKLKIVVKELSGKSIDELLAEGAEKLATMPAGGGGAAAAPAAGGAAPAEEKKEEKKEEEPEESDDDMGFGLFD